MMLRLIAKGITAEACCLPVDMHGGRFLARRAKWRCVQVSAAHMTRPPGAFQRNQGPRTTNRDRVILTARSAVRFGRRRDL